MAKRSDFAQKLLDDLRQRKERLASSSRNSSRSSTSSMAVVDAYSYAKKNYRGSKDTRTNDMIGAGTRNARPRSSAGSKSSFVGDSGQHIVPYNDGSARSSHQIGDLSMALSLALQNGAKARRSDSSTMSFALEFLQQIGMRPAQAQPSKMELRSGSSRRFQAVQIEEISKGANRLNQILRACSNGVNLDQFSIQIGKDLLKGAVDLENSLKMLVGLQEASGKFAEPQRKNRIKLLEEDEEEDRGATVAKEWRLDRPRFSFDRTEKHGSHNRSASSGANAISSSTLEEFQPKPSSSQSKARIPGVIAKLMGLENLPGSDCSRNLPSKVAAKVKEEIGNMSGRKETASLTKKLRVEAETTPFVVNSSFVVVRESTLPSNFRFDVVFHGEKPTTRSEIAAPRKERAREMNMKNNPPAVKERQPQPPVRDRSAKLAVSPPRKPKEREAKSKSDSSKSNKPTQLSKEKPKSPKRSTTSVRSELSPKVEHQDEVFRDRSSAEANTFRTSKIPNSEQSLPETELPTPSLQRIKVPRSYNEHKLPQRTDEIVARRSVRNQSSAPKEAKNPRRRGQLLKEEAKDQREVIREAKKRFGLFTMKEDVRTRMEEPAQQVLQSQDVTLDDQPSQARLCEDQKLVDIETGLDDTMNIDGNAPKTEPAEEPITLTDSEKRLKDILVTSPVFLNTAVALFDLEIPIDVLQPSSHNDETNEIDHASGEKEHRRLTLDCGYEVMRRKGRRQELSLHPNHAKASIGLVRIRALDGLVRELRRDMEKLRVHGGGSGGDEEEYLVAMQESDVKGREPDVNCMWDLGWNDSFFAFVEVGDVARDVEKFVLNVLLDEITGQLLRHGQ